MILKRNIFKKTPNLIVFLIFNSLVLCIGLKLNYIQLPIEKIIAYNNLHILVSLCFLFLFLVLLPEFMNRKSNIKKNNGDYIAYVLFVWLMMSLSSTIIHQKLLYSEFVFGQIFLFYAFIHLVGIVILSLSFTFSSFSDQIVTDSENIQHPIHDKVNNDVDENVESYLVLVGKLKSDRLKVNIEDLYYIKSSDNYCEIKYVMEGKINIDLFRVSIRDLETQIQDDRILRVHKSYILNLNYVSQIQGNMNNTKAVLKNCDAKIPIARSKRDMVIDEFKAIKGKDYLFVENIGIPAIKL